MTGKRKRLPAGAESAPTRSSDQRAVSRWGLGVVIALTVVILLGLSGCAGNAGHAYVQHPDVSSELDEALSSTIMSENESKYYTGECPSEGHVVLDMEGDPDEEDGEVTVYALVSYSRYGFEDGNFVSVSGSFGVPTVITFVRSDDGGIVCTSYTEAEEGDRFVDWIRKTFPTDCREEAIEPTSDDGASLKAQRQAYAAAYLESIGREAAIGDYSDFDHTLLSDVGISAEVDNALIGNHDYDFYPLGLGTREQIEDGVRYVYETTYDSDAHLLTYEKYEYDTGKVVEHIEVDSTTGEVVASQRDS